MCASELIRGKKKKKEKEVIGECHREPFIKSRHKMLLKTFAIEMSFIHRVVAMHACVHTCTTCASVAGVCARLRTPPDGVWSLSIGGRGLK